MGMKHGGCRKVADLTPANEIIFASKIGWLFRRDGLTGEKLRRTTIDRGWERNDIVRSLTPSAAAATRQNVRRVLPAEAAGAVIRTASIPRP